MCYKCQGFGHKAEKCEKDQACVKCTGNHLVKDCVKLREDYRCKNSGGLNHELVKELSENDSKKSLTRTSDGLKSYLEKFSDSKKRNQILDIQFLRITMKPSPKIKPTNY